MTNWAREAEQRCKNEKATFFNIIRMYLKTYYNVLRSRGIAIPFEFEPEVCSAQAIYLFVEQQALFCLL